MIILSSNTQGVGAPRALWRFPGRSEAARGSQLRKYSKNGRTPSTIFLRIFSKSFQSPSKNEAESSQDYLNPVEILPKPMPNPSKIDPEGLLELILDQCFKRYRFKRPKSKHNAPKSGPKPAQGAPNPGQIEPKTLPNRLFKLFRSLFFFSIRNLHNIFIDFLLIFICFSRGRPLQNTVKTSVFCMFLQNHNFYEKYQKS